ncbi:MAG: amino acid permease [Actinobacteria bacterium]|nr:amino acid permease [Actinomycetota bacterium]
MKLLSRLDAVFIGLAAMLGAGVFVVFGPASELAGSLLLVSILLAALVAYLNAASIAQLAAVVTRSGGAYAYGRHYLGNAWGFLAGMSFLVGKIGSAAAIALVFATYLTPGFEILTAVLAVVVMAAINIAGINRTAFGSKVLATITLSFLTVLIVAGLFAEPAEGTMAAGGFPGVLTAASLFFFAFAGYARVATLGGEVRDSEKNVPSAIRISLVIVLVTYLALALVLMMKLGPGLAGSLIPLAALAGVALGLEGSVVAVFAAVATLGSLLALLAGMSRTASEMAGDAELPKVLSKKLKNGSPALAEVVISLLVIVLVVSGSILLTIGLSSFAILSYYAIANLAAYRQPRSETARAKWLNLLGLGLCVLLGLSVPFGGLVLGAAILTLALILRWGLRAMR